MNEFLRLASEFSVEVADTLFLLPQVESHDGTHEKEDEREVFPKECLPALLVGYPLFHAVVVNGRQLEGCLSHAFVVASLLLVGIERGVLEHRVCLVLQGIDVAESLV